MSRNPSYHRLAGQIMELLYDLPAERRDALPSERLLAARLHAARNTVRRALLQLQHAGLIRSLHGKGSYPVSNQKATVVAFGYFTHGRQSKRFYEWLAFRLAQAGYRLVVHDTGMRAECVDWKIFQRIAADAALLVFFVTSLPDGRNRLLAIRKLVPDNLPMIFINDTLNFKLHSRRAIDFIHYNYDEMIRRLVRLLWRDGIRHPIHITYPEMDDLYLSHLRVNTFIGELAARGEHAAAGHVVPMNALMPERLRILFERGRRGHAWKPDAIILPWTCEDIFRGLCKKGGLHIPSGIPFIYPGNISGKYLIPVDKRDMAEATADLIQSRLHRPSRPNLHVSIELNVHRKLSGGGT